MSDSLPIALVAGASGIVGRGVAEQLVAAGWRVLCASRSGGGDLAGTQGLKVDPVCSYARVYMRRHPATLALLA